ncbi:hypothetical protein [Microtetraspora fusca]|uniref:DUF3592 domain-containing protein n=1 Tax=Microtetraspora fusca TaxID=1997 RepID=A0ABW6V534_MICFU|nr:hypothetical protein [Microtetraspora fusca]
MAKGKARRREVANQEPFPIWSLLGAILATVFAGWMLVFSGLNMDKEVRVLHGDGVKGTFTVVDRNCTRQACSWTGRFVSDDGRIVVPSITTGDLSSRDAPLGSQVSVIYGGDALYSDGSFEWAGYFRLIIYALIFAAIAVALWHGTITWAMRRIRRP